ncbi:hypothetical protein G4B88_009188 [Cannabis sativa]|uniref:GDSL esterase/lipase n=1 Tax=Cannabis sativa TaxID=3483 RepID=A0A7J6G2I2_CANSA|nr:hypothetical protein G4B88_009188 [Cannabis sativa]
MAKYHKNFIFTISLLLSYLSLSISYYDHHNKCSFPKECGKAKTNGMFVFGSSLVDNGNNNFFENRAKADYLPYGMDFPNGPSGRFTNGKNIIDLLGEHLKLPIDFIPSFKDPSTKGLKIVYGVNHASASSGILDDTGIIANT